MRKRETKMEEGIEKMSEKRRKRNKLRKRKKGERVIEEEENEELGLIAQSVQLRSMAGSSISGKLSVGAFELREHW